MPRALSIFHFFRQAGLSDCLWDFLVSVMASSLGQEQRHSPVCRLITPLQEPQRSTFSGLLASTDGLTRLPSR
jgi:hypothetical protein